MEAAPLIVTRKPSLLERHPSRQPVYALVVEAAPLKKHPGPDLLELGAIRLLKRKLASHPIASGLGPAHRWPAESAPGSQARCF